MEKTLSHKKNLFYALQILLVLQKRLCLSTIPLMRSDHVKKIGFNEANKDCFTYQLTFDNIIAAFDLR